MLKSGVLESLRVRGVNFSNRNERISLSWHLVKEMSSYSQRCGWVRNSASPVYS
jgi:hypothetical protein